ncbi:sensor histidine kinase [Herbaspirillum sp. alder98]|uniref:sensor histidine kinase n=1 Tax=Herbaspirillum sp. alder98 TaxID=2913096 RepID=UPI001CD8CD14|nr:sensor histidine kinase [Herbaspirillum sp. alder98]MCA1326643.1 sensor histidine kinase [Herbaspirillum sp. alder98]
MATMQAHFPATSIDPRLQEERIRDQERSRIARDLHDELGAHLTGIGMALGQLREQINDHPAAEQADYAQTLLHRANDALHAVIDGLRPPIVEFGLADTLQWAAREFTRHSGIPCSVQAPAELDGLDESAVLMVLRIVREALSNVSRHAQARQVSLSARRDGKGIHLQIADDGRGFDGTHPPRLGHGLGNMRHRAQALGGGLQIFSTPGQGTVVVLTLPVAG